MLKPATMIFSLLSAQCVFAELAIPPLVQQNISSLNLEDTTLAKTGLQKNEDDITADQDINQVNLSSLQLHEAKVWGLTLEEEKRYVLLMQNRSLMYYEGLRLTPIDILGLNARNEAERNHFAELAANQEAQKISKNIAWNNAFYKSYSKLFAHVPIVGDFDPAPFSPYAYRPLQLKPGDNLYFFIKPNDAVQTILMMLQDAIATAPNSHLHIMILGSDSLSIQLFANQHQIPLHLVNSGQITLNQGDLHFQSLDLNTKTTPLLLLSAHGQSSIVDLGRF